METRRLLIVGSSDGIGLATARRLAGQGWQVVGISKSESTLVHERYRHIVADVVSPEYPSRLRAAVEEDGPFDACIYCAGIGNPFDVAHIEHDEHVFAVNLSGALRTAQEILPPMVAAGRGHLVVLSSQSDELIIPSAPSYSASKAAMSTYFEAVGLALRPKSVAVTNLRFGFVNTKMARSPWKPFCMTVEKAAIIIERCLVTRPLRLTRPLRTAVLVAILRCLTRWRIRLASLGRKRLRPPHHAR
jgi:NAD(P)-dependent dehydrogenase (short-subunit alcohol dehydrogenase family)